MAYMTKVVYPPKPPPERGNIDYRAPADWKDLQIGPHCRPFNSPPLQDPSMGFRTPKRVTPVRALIHFSAAPRWLLEHQTIFIPEP